MIGQEAWGDDLNSYLMWIDARLDVMDSALVALTDRVTTLESQPEHVYNSYSWQFSNSAPPPTGNQVRADNTNLALATMLEFRKLDNDGNDRSGVLGALTQGCRIRLSDWDNAAANYRYEVSGAPTVTTDTVQIPVTWLDGSGTIPNAKAEVEILMFVNL